MVTERARPDAGISTQPADQPVTLLRGSSLIRADVEKATNI